MSIVKGKLGEDRAISFLEDRGFLVIERNFYSRFGEIDLIASRDGVLHFVEVKSGECDPIYQITPRKLSKILKTVQIYLSKKRIYCDYVVDAVIVEDDIELIENITS